MKKVFLFLTIVGITAVVACGPSAEDKAAQEKAMQDSIAAADAAMQAAEEAAMQAAATVDSAASAMVDTVAAVVAQ